LGSDEGDAIAFKLEALLKERARQHISVDADLLGEPFKGCEPYGMIARVVPAHAPIPST